MYSLETPLHRFRQETMALRDLFLASTPETFTTPFWLQPDKWSIQCYVLIRMLDEWGLFCRELILRSARGGVMSAGGLKVRRSAAVASGTDPLLVLRKSFKKKKTAQWEPHWYNPADAIDAASRLNVRNLAEIAAGLGLAGTAPDDLRACRNYVAHRSPRAARDMQVVRARFTPPRTDKCEAIPNVALADGRTLLTYWCDDLLMRARSAVA